MKRTAKPLPWLLVLVLLLSAANLGVLAQGPVPNTGTYHEEAVVLPDGREAVQVTINGPPEPPPGYVRPLAPSEGRGVTAATTLPVPAYNWSFGCTATSAAMIAAYYDRAGYPNMYAGPTNGGVMPMDNSVWPDWYDGSAWRHQCPLSATHNGLDGRSTDGHVDDYWERYGYPEGPPYPAYSDPWVSDPPEHTLGDCTSDYMNTNKWYQTHEFNVDGGTTYFYYGNGSKTPWTVLQLAGAPFNLDGPAVGFTDFYVSRGYTVLDAYNQLIDTVAAPGFTYSQYKAEIDAGRPVMIHVTGHTMVGVGYDDTVSDLMYIHDTWDYQTHTMIWGASYSGMLHQAVSIVQLGGSPSPGIIIDGRDTGDWGTTVPAMTDGTGDAAGNSNQDITDVYAVYSDINVTFRVDTLATPELSQVEIYVDNDTGGCAQTSGHPGDTGTIYDKWITVDLDGWTASMDECAGGWNDMTGAVVVFAAEDIVEIRVSRADLGDADPMAFFVKYGTTSDFAPDSGQAPTLVELTSFTATAGEGLVRVAWETASETDNAGFNLWRSQGGGEYVKLNATLIPAEGGPTWGASYAYDDTEIIEGMSYRYKLEDVDLHGRSTFHTPVEVTAGVFYRLHLPLVLKGR